VGPRPLGRVEDQGDVVLAAVGQAEQNTVADLGGG